MFLYFQLYRGGLASPAAQHLQFIQQQFLANQHLANLGKDLGNGQLKISYSSNRIINSFPRHLDAKKTGFNLMIVHFYTGRKLDIIRC